jgi:hypothetical protein
VTKNQAALIGGGIANHGHLALIDTIFTDNEPNNVSGY